MSNISKDAAAIESGSRKRSDCTGTASTTEPTPEKPEKESRSALTIGPPVEHTVELPAQGSGRMPTAFPCEAPRGGTIAYRPYLPSAFMPEGYMPILEAASLLAFGNSNFLDYTLEKKFDPHIGRESLVAKESCPEIDRELARLVDKHTVGDLIIIGRRRAVIEWRNQVRDPGPLKGKIGNRYDAIPSDYFRFNDWSFGVFDPFGIIAKGSDPFGAEWFYPAVASIDVKRLKAEEPGNTDPKVNRSTEKRDIPKRLLVEELEQFAG